MKIDIAVDFGNTFLGALVIGLTLYDPPVSVVALTARMILFAAKAMLVLAVGCPHPRTTDSFSPNLYLCS